MSANTLINTQTKPLPRSVPFLYPYTSATSDGHCSHVPSRKYEMDIGAKVPWPTVVLGFHLDAPEICALLGIYAAYNGSLLPTFRDLCRNVRKKLSFYAP